MDTVINMEEAQRAMNKAKVELMRKPDSAFFTTLCFSLRHIWDDSIPTAATDGTRVLYNPEFFMNLSHPERVFLMIHESMHVAYLHMLRKGSRNHRIWNMAADHVINLQLLERDFVMPQGGLADAQYTDMSTEQVYEQLMQDSDAENQTLLMEDLMEPSSEALSEEITQEVEDILVRASIQSKMQGDRPGTIPGDIQIALDKLLDPKLPWNHILQKFVHRLTKNDYSFRRPNRRFFPDFYMPSLYTESVIDLAIAIDTSGSVSDHDFHVFVSEVVSIFRMVQPENITLIQFDTNIKSVTKTKNIKDVINTPFTGRGGTIIGPVMDWAHKNKPELLMVFTDGEFSMTPNIDNYRHPLIWVIHNNRRFEANKGKVIHYEI